MTVARRLVLLGAGHAHALVLESLARAPLRDVEVIVISPTPQAPYSGMVPGWLAGMYRYDEICIDFARLARGAGATFVAGAAEALDAGARRLTLAGGQACCYDVLSIDVGSTLEGNHGEPATILPMRPIAALHDAWEPALARLTRAAADRPVRIAAIGGGAAGIETLLAALAQVRSRKLGARVESLLVTRSATLLPGLARGAARHAQRVLERRGVAVRYGDSDRDPDVLASDLVLRATGAQAFGWPATSGLAVGRDGFIRVDSTLRSLSHPEVLAAGDCADWGGHPLPKAGVYAVRMGPVLAHNLRAAFGAGAFRRYRPQRRFLALLSTADRRAIAAWGPVSAEGASVWRWKDRIDRAFVARFADPAPAPQRGTLAP